MKFKPQDLTLAALFAAITAVCAQIAIPLGPISPVPFTLLVLAVCLSGAILGSKLGALSQVVYLFLGAVGVPVFAGFIGGLNVILGPTGGYLLSLPLAAFVIGWICQRNHHQLACFFSMLLGLGIIYAMGVTQLKFYSNFSWTLAFTYGVLPFIVLDLIKIVIATGLALALRRVLAKNQLLPYSLK